MEPKAIIEAIKALPSEQRREVLEAFCPECGSAEGEPQCFCDCDTEDL